MSKKPIIGITGSAKEVHGIDHSFVHSKYPEAVLRAGGVPVILPLGNEEAAKAWAEVIDGLLLSGGEDVDPQSYGGNPDPELGKVVLERDETEIALVAEVKNRKLPVFAICRGIASLNVALGGDLIQDIEREFEDPLKHHQEGPRTNASHDLHVEEGSRLHEIFGETLVPINSMHHQVLGKVAEGLKVTGKAPDGVIEAVEGTDPDWSVLGVQWHPEEMAVKYDNMQKLFDVFVEECEKAASEPV
ncbi:gamma-glutamyl-gamma-aminobutyrate hydrolase family protein [Metabacillus sp. GX 13764]|uniref:gamma-glutamyl-gamma-aminobutyrate hydrolase family protein n=1 Tax=Metabacillus kandeliae TaxID=2900151 RepID=UPI001E344C16|nr:gamma-glutamyl-gamma-aminobutyrate hydrolase family protein [Metabacillus kandeliae]MCD7034382.1 gamma-glutamyl-gamma-aminobutyrate hydrolase family protein [Metabacillus kandeliae]